MFVCSTLYHSLTCCGNQCAVELFCILDHTAIYVLIAGSYTPYLFGSLYDHHPTVAVLGAVFVWSLALVGISLDLCFDPKNKTIRLLSLVIYVVQGWSVAFIAPWLFPLVSSATLNYLAGGGLAYTSGVYFYVRGCTNQKYHIVWHVYVFVGAVLHFYSILAFYSRFIVTTKVSRSFLVFYRVVGHSGETRDLDRVDRGQKQDLTASDSRSEV